jgi:hypothetical protein
MRPFRYIGFFRDGRAFTYFAACLCLSACGQALPMHTPGGDLGSGSLKAEEAAQAARRDADRVKAEAEKSEKLLKEVEALRAKVDEALRSCNSLNARIPKTLKPKIIYVQPKPTPTPQPDAEAANPTQSDPEYSKSDAPPGGRPADTAAPAEESHNSSGAAADTSRSDSAHGHH